MPIAFMCFTSPAEVAALDAGEVRVRLAADRQAERIGVELDAARGHERQGRGPCELSRSRDGQSFQIGGANLRAVKYVIGLPICGSVDILHCMPTSAGSSASMSSGYVGACSRVGPTNRRLVSARSAAIQPRPLTMSPCHKPL
jgi:hypothetical protein